MKMTVDTKQNRRLHQEDRFFIDHLDSSNVFFGVFDGHGGEIAAEYAAANCSRIFRELLLGSNFAGLDILSEVIHILNFDLRHSYTGTTASIVHLNEKQKFANVAVIGDSPVIIKDADGKIWVAPEHNVRSNAAEAAAATASEDGIIVDGYLFDARNLDGGGLQMSRALGDRELDVVLNREPEVFRISLAKNSWVLCGTDGILDPGHKNTDQLVNNLANLIDVNSVTADDVIQAAISAGSDDNATAILIRL